LKDPLLPANRRKTAFPGLEALSGESPDNHNQTVLLTEHDDDSFRITKLEGMPFRDRVNSDTAALMPDKGQLNPYARESRVTQARIDRKT